MVEERKGLARFAYVTGASRGIGEAIATALAADGWNLALTCYQNVDRLTALSSDLKETYGIQVMTGRVDAGSYDETRAFADQVLSAYGQVDAVINNAGIASIGLLTDLSPEEWDQIISTDLSSVFYTSKCFLPQMIRRRSGRIISISSMWGRVGASCEAAYSAAKGGVNALTRALAKEAAPSGIAVNAIACGVIDTDMNAAFSEEERADLKEEIPSGRFGRPEEVGDLVVSLLKSSPYLTGQIIGLDGAIL